ncbi:MAG: methyltransferase domain-containing protein [Burkholderiales bacterium]|nr:methyltransferase domain-containing protein [Burkholderiales bacterium]
MFICVHRRLFLVLALALALPGLAPAAEKAPPRYSKVPASPDGIGRLYLGREIARMMGHEGAAWLERIERANEERPDLVLEALDVKPGMTIADIGAGTGYYARRLARRAGSKGTVYAVELQPEMMKLLEKHLSLHRATNVTTVLGTATDPRLPPSSLDLAVMVDVYHEFEFPHEMLAAIVRAVKPGGRIAFVEYRADDPAVPVKRLHTTSEEQVRREAAAHPLLWVRTVRALPWQHVIVFRRSEAAPEGSAADRRR